MTATLLKLQATLWKRTVSGNNAAITMMVMVALYGVIGLVSLSIMLGAGLAEGKTGLLAGIVATGSIAYVVAAIMWPSGEGQLHPASLAVMPVKPRDVMPALAVATLMQSRGVMAAFCTFVTAVVATIFYPLLLIPVIWIMLALALIMTLLLGELLSSLASSSSSRVSKERMSIIASLGFIVVIIGYNLMIGSEAMARVDAFGMVMRWTPLGSTAGTIEAVAAGNWLEATSLLILTLIYIGAGMWLWSKLINRALTAPLDSGGQAKKKIKVTDANSRVLLVPGASWSPFGAVFSRSIHYLVRDSRLLASLITFPILGLLFVFQSFTVTPMMIYFGLVIMAVFGGAVATNDFGYDGPSTWLNIVSGAPIRTLLLARHAASMFPAVVMVIVYAIVAFIVADNTVVTFLIVVITVGILATTAGVALLLSVFNPFATAKPGTSPWGDRSGYSGAAFLAAFATMFLGWIPSLPAIALTSIGYQADIMWVLILGQVLALVIPGGLYAVLIRVCTKRVEARMPEIFDKVKTHVG